MKKFILTVIFLLLFVPTLMYASNCDNPINKSYVLGDIKVYFTEGYGPSENIMQVIIGEESYYYSYEWDKDRCRVILKGTNPPVYLDFDEDWFDLFSGTPTPRFIFSEMTSVD